MLDANTLNTATTGFATIVSLVCNFASLRQGSPEKDIHLYTEFMNYLRTNHQEVMHQVESNNNLAHSLKTLLSQGIDDIIQKLDALDRIMAGVAANLDGFKQLSTAVYQNEILSEEALDILKRFYASGAAKFIETSDMARGGKTFVPISGTGGNLYYNHRFLEDDLLTLCKFGFLELSHDSKGGRIFHLTRLTERYIKTLGVNQ